MNPDQLRQGLGNLCAAGIKRQFSLGEDDRLGRDRESCYSPKSSRWDVDKLQIRDMERIRFVCDRREIGGALAGFFMLVLSYFQACDLQCAILADREMYGVVQREMHDVCGILGR